MMSAARPDGWSSKPPPSARHPPMVVICGNLAWTARATRTVSTWKCSSDPTEAGSAAISAPLDDTATSGAAGAGELPGVAEPAAPEPGSAAAA